MGVIGRATPLTRDFARYRADIKAPLLLRVLMVVKITIGGAEGIRTPDPLDANEVRYQAAPQPPEGPRRYQPPAAVLRSSSASSAASESSNPSAPRCSGRSAKRR